MVTIRRPSHSGVVRLAWAGALAGICLTGCRGESRRAHDTDNPFADLRAVRLTTRPFAPRLSGGFAHAPLATPTRGPAVDSPVDIRLAAARLEKRLAESRTPRSLAEYAAGALLVGHVPKAIAALEEARAAAPHEAAILSDLAAAYLLRAAQASGTPTEDQVRALDVASLAVMADPLLPEAMFNRALAMERMLPPGVVAAAWRDVLGVERDLGWTTEIRDHMGAARAPVGVSVEDLIHSNDVPRAVGENRQGAREAVLDRLAPAWAAALQAHRDRDAANALQQARAIASALLAQTHDPFVADLVARMRDAAAAQDFADYGRAHEEYVALNLDAAERIFSRIYRRVTTDNPLRCWTGLQLARIAIDRREIPRARVLLREPARLAMGGGYRAVEAGALKLAGLIDHQSNAIDAALEKYERSAAMFAELGERANELGVYTAAADNLRLRGERRRSWSYVLKVLARADQIALPLSRYLVFFNASLFAADEGWWQAALAFQDIAIHEVESAPSRGPVFEGLTMKARLQMLSGDGVGANRTLENARAVLQQLGTDDYASATLDAVVGERDTVADPKSADAELSRAIVFFERAEPAQTARLYLLRGRARLSTGDVVGAEEDFASGIADVERRRNGIGSAHLRVSYLDDSADLFGEMAALQLHARQDADSAFKVVEQGRARTLADATHAPILSLASVQSALPHGVALVEYKVFRDEVACWIVTRAASRVARIQASPAALTAAVERLRAAVQQPSTEDATAPARALYRQLLEPFEAELAGTHTLVIIPDGALTRLPFAALRSASGLFLIQSRALVMMPSASSFVASLQEAARPRRGGGGALLVGDPAVNRGAFPGLPALPGAAAEVRSLVPLYARPATMVGADATRHAFLAALPSAEIVHFAGHAVENTDNPERSALVLAPSSSDPDGALRAVDIARLRLSGTRLVVLAACDTADGPVTRSEGVHSLARPFLDAGAANVVATLWPIDDAVSAKLFRLLHQYVTRGDAPVDALRAAQVDMIRGGGAPADPRAWSGVVVLGAIGKPADGRRQQ